MTHKLLLLTVCAGLSVSLSWGDEARCPSSNNGKSQQQAGIVEDSSRTASTQNTRHDNPSDNHVRSDKSPVTTGNPAGVNEDGDRTAADRANPGAG
jgi:hypothetical protein